MYYVVEYTHFHPLPILFRWTRALTVAAQVSSTSAKQQAVGKCILTVMTTGSMKLKQVISQPITPRVVSTIDNTPLCILLSLILVPSYIPNNNLLFNKSASSEGIKFHTAGYR